MTKKSWATWATENRKRIYVLKKYTKRICVSYKIENGNAFREKKRDGYASPATKKEDAFPSSIF